jgi:hypothetical protein
MPLVELLFTPVREQRTPRSLAKASFTSVPRAL